MYKSILFASALLLPAGLGAEDGPPEYEKLVAAFAEEALQYRDADAMVPALLPDESPFHAKFLSAAKRHEGSEAALPFLGWLLQNAPRNEQAYGAAVAAIDAIASRKAAELREQSLDEAGLYKESKSAVKHLKYNTVGDEVFARTLLDAKILALAAKKKSTRTACERSVFKLQNLQVGMVAPDIVATDLDGVEFKLSDYRDKVVIIDFWGSW